MFDVMSRIPHGTVCQNGVLLILASNTMRTPTPKSFEEQHKSQRAQFLQTTTGNFTTQPQFAMGD